MGWSANQFSGTAFTASGCQTLTLLDFGPLGTQVSASAPWAELLAVGVLALLSWAAGHGKARKLLQKVRSTLAVASAHFVTCCSASRSLHSHSNESWCR